MKGWKGEKVKRWKGEKRKRWKGERVKRWLRPPTCQLVYLSTRLPVNSSTCQLVNLPTRQLVIYSSVVQTNPSFACSSPLCAPNTLVLKSCLVRGNNVATAFLSLTTLKRDWGTFVLFFGHWNESFFISHHYQTADRQHFILTFCCKLFSFCLIL